MISVSGKIIPHVILCTLTISLFIIMYLILRNDFEDKAESQLLLMGSIIGLVASNIAYILFRKK